MTSTVTLRPLRLTHCIVVRGRSELLGARRNVARVIDAELWQEDYGISEDFVPRVGAMVQPGAIDTEVAKFKASVTTCARRAGTRGVSCGLFQDFDAADIAQVPQLLSDHPDNPHRVEALKQQTERLRALSR